MNRLPYDYCRCEGAGCDVANDCLRHLSWLDVGPHTPIAENLCVWFPRQKAHFMQIKPEVSENAPTEKPKRKEKEAAVA